MVLPYCLFNIIEYTIFVTLQRLIMLDLHFFLHHNSLSYYTYFSAVTFIHIMHMTYYCFSVC